ncbi:hypothetical protein WJX74_009342 [Apatococcus lobatus]|uniref:Protein MEMO1 n=1 Tax=Apatococcus lobatus TaxID=904363 RepID=A0AAW1R3G3_9CHLO
MPRSVRQPIHAGSWYDAEGDKLSASLTEWLRTAKRPGTAFAQAIVSPHAGYRYCGDVAAYAYSQVQVQRIKRIFILGPSHHVYLRRCALSNAAVYQTPLGSLEIDRDICAQLMATGDFQTMELDVDEAEHSIEMQLPYVRHIFRDEDIKIVPIMVGSLMAESEARYAEILTPYFKGASSLFVISSDFCHWGSRFSYTFQNPAQGPIHKSIEWLDRLGMDIIEKGNAPDFHAYLKSYGNTICGRHPIGILLHILQNLTPPCKTQFVKYSQSSKCKSPQDSSVSYAAAVVCKEPHTAA